MLLNAMYCLDNLASEISVMGVMGPFNYLKDKKETARERRKNMKNNTNFEKEINSLFDTVFPKHEADDEEIVNDIKAAEAAAEINIGDNEFPELVAIVKADPAKADALKYADRVDRGYNILCYTFAKLCDDGSEAATKFKPNDLDKNVINVISEGLGLCKLEDTNCVKIKSINDLKFNDKTKNPIIIDSAIKEAYRMYPVNFVDINNILDVKDFDHEETVNVMDVEQDVVESIKKDEAKVKEKAVEINIETVDPATLEHPQDDTPVKENNGNVKHGTISPITTDQYGRKCIDVVAVGKTEISDYQKNTFNKLFGKFLSDKEYILGKGDGGCLYCTIKDQKGDYTVWIDPGMCVGNGWNVLGNVMTGNPNQPYDTMPVSATDKDITRKIFTIPFYVLSPDDIARSAARMFKDQSIYSVVDMSGMRDNLKKLTPQEMDKLSNKLSCIIKLLRPEQLGRLRFAKFRSVDNFRLFSDEYCTSVFPGVTLTNISDVRIFVNGDEVSIKFNGTETKTRIGYNVMS